MVIESDIWRSANLLIEQHGYRALVVSVERYLEFIRQEDEEGAALWRRIGTAVDQLLRATSGLSAH
jgi:hypothetical protein